MVRVRTNEAEVISRLCSPGIPVILQTVAPALSAALQKLTAGWRGAREALARNQHGLFVFKTKQNQNRFSITYHPL